MNKDVKTKKSQAVPEKTGTRRPKRKTEKNKEWLELCKWIEREILDYDENQKMQKKACLRIQGLFKGQVFANNNCETFGSYNCEVVLNTFKANKAKIKNALAGKTFASEENKVGYVCAIVRDRINDMYTRMKNAKKNQEQAEISINASSVYNETAAYQRQTEDNCLESLESLW